MLRRVCFQRRMLCFRTPNNETSFYPLRVPTGCWSGTRLFMLGTRGCICSSHSHKSKLGPPRGATNTGPLHGISPSCFRTVGSDEFWLGTRLGDVELDGKLENCCRYKQRLGRLDVYGLLGPLLSISAWPNVLFFLRHLVSLQATAYRPKSKKSKCVGYTLGGWWPQRAAEHSWPDPTTSSASQHAPQRRESAPGARGIRRGTTDPLNRACAPVARTKEQIPVDSSRRRAPRSRVLERALHAIRAPPWWERRPELIVPRPNG